VIEYLSFQVFLNASVVIDTNVSSFASFECVSTSDSLGTIETELKLTCVQLRGMSKAEDPMFG
jgi:hypothetical protein